MSKLGALIVLDCILGREIDIDSIPMQEPAIGVTPGGTLDLAGAGVRADIRHMAERGETYSSRPTTGGVMEAEEMNEAQRLEREAALAELMGGGAVAAGRGPESRPDEGRVVYDLADTGGWVHNR